MRCLSKILILSVTFIMSFCVNAQPPQVGDLAPSLRVESGDGKIMTLDMLKGKVVVLVYNTRDTYDRNAKLRETLNKFYNAQSDERKYNCFKLAILDCSSAFFPIDFLWRKKLIDVSKSKKMDIYGDWDGKVAADYGFNLNDSNMVIIDKYGIIKYISQKEITDDKEINKIIELLNKIT